jgi:AMMECR1 domain-containing protein/orotate phosphoribosyltransferase
MGKPTPTDRVRLLTLLRQYGILHASPRQPVLSRDGTPARWMLDSLCVSLDPEGIVLAGKCLLACLERFQGRQVATYGVTAISLLTSCILQSEGRYHGLIVRKELKQYGSCKLIEGRIDPEEPTIILDDSVSSGTNMLECCARLEDAGLRVEGGVCLVRFGWLGGFARMQERGYHMETVYDIWDDFIYHMEGEPDPLPNPTKVFPAWTWQTAATPEGGHPAHLARMIMESYLRYGQVLRPPTSLDAAYDGAGGIWVSVRDRADIHRRYGRDGFWHFPGEESGPLGQDLALAAVKTAAQLPSGDAGLQLLEQSAIAVTFFSRLEACTVGELDNDRYGIVVCSRERLGRMGGALPRMPGISGTWQQFQHARMKNAGLLSFEPYQLYRHDVVKVVEPGVTWQPTGVPKPLELPWYEMPDVAGRVATRARHLVLETLGLGATSDAPLPDDLLGDGLDSIYVTVYMQGHLRGCMGSVVRHLDHDLGHLVRCALQDPRFSDRDAAPDDIAVTVSLLYNSLTLGPFSPEEVVQQVLHGQQALMVYQGGQVGLLLPFVVAANNLSPQEYALEVIAKAGIPGPPYTWYRFDCTTWLADRTSVPRPLQGALPVAPAPPALDVGLGQLATLLSQYLLRHQREDGSLFLRYLPHQDILYEGEDLPRTAHGAWVLCRAGQQLGDRALHGGGRKLTALLVSQLVQDQAGHCWLQPEWGPASVAEVSFLLLALCSTPRRDPTPAVAGRLAAVLWSRFTPHGRIATHREPQPQDDVFQDFFPGQVLLALAHACRVGVSQVEQDSLSRAFDFYRHRFRYKRRFAQVSWHMQAFTAWWRVLREPHFASYVFEIADWLVGYQQVEGGGFLNEEQQDTPGYTTVLYLEGLGVATRLAEAIGDHPRATRYRAACEKGFRFVHGLVIQAPMTTLLPNPAWAIGGVRTSLLQDQVRIDFVQHALSAVLELHPHDALDWET